MLQAGLEPQTVARRVVPLFIGQAGRTGALGVGAWGLELPESGRVETYQAIEMYYEGAQKQLLASQTPSRSNELLTLFLLLLCCLCEESSLLASLSFRLAPEAAAAPPAGPPPPPSAAGRCADTGPGVETEEPCVLAGWALWFGPKASGEGCAELLPTAETDDPALWLGLRGAVAAVAAPGPKPTTTPGPDPAMCGALDVGVVAAEGRAPGRKDRRSLT